MGVNLSGSTPANPSGPVSWLDTIGGSAGALGDGLAAGFMGLLDGIGTILSGAVHLVGSAFNAVVDGFSNMLGWIGHAVGSIFGHSSPPPVPEPMPTIFNPIKTNLEAALQPHFDKIDEALVESERLGGEITTINNTLSTITGDIEDWNDELSVLLDPEHPDSALWQIQTDINAANAAFQRQQVQINELVEERDTVQDQALDALQLAQEAMLQTVTRTMYIPRNTPVQDDYFSVQATSNAHEWRVVAKPGWVGFFTFQTVYNANADPAIDGYKVVDTRSWTMAAYNRHQSILSYWVQPGKAKTIEWNTPTIAAPQNQWYRIPMSTFNGGYQGTDWIVPQTGVYPLYFRVGWDAANYWDGHGIRIMVNGQEIHRNGVVTIGPLIGHEYRTQTIVLENYHLNQGDRLQLHVYAEGSNPVNRLIRTAWFRTSWVEPANADDIQGGD